MQGEWLRRPESGAALVFVHGVLSDGDACWRNANGTYWPQLLADETSAIHFGIYVFTYKTGIFSGTYRLGDVVDALKEHMRLDKVLECSKLIFAAHSMGGIVVRKLLVERAADFIDRKTTIGLFLLASPSLGSDYANLLKPIARAFGHSQADALRFSQQNAWLLDLDKEFNNLKQAGKIQLLGKELVEDVFFIFDKLLIGRQVVQPFSGARYFGEAYKVPNSDHFSIAKPASSKDVQHRLLLQFVADVLSTPSNDVGREVESKVQVSSSRDHSIAMLGESREPLVSSAEYDRWHAGLGDGAVELVLNPSAARDINTFAKILSNALAQHNFSPSVTRNAEVILRELLSNVARHVRGVEAAIKVELVTTHLPAIVLSVGDQGGGYDLWQTVEEQFHRMKGSEREHGLGRICRLADQVATSVPSDKNQRFAITCTLYDVPRPSCLCDGFDWCGVVILDYSSPPSVWFGERRYSLWWYYPEESVHLKQWAVLGALDLAIDQNIAKIMNLYLENILAPTRPYVFFEVRGHGPTEPGDPRTSEATITQAVVTCFAKHFAERKVVLYASHGAYTHALSQMAQQFDVPLFVSEDRCRGTLARINRELRRKQ